MVNNKLKILDEGQIKMCPEVKEMVKLKYYDYCRLTMSTWLRLKSVTMLDDNLNEITKIIDNDKFIEPQGLMLKFITKYFDQGYLGDGLYHGLKKEFINYDMKKDEENIFRKHFTEQDLMDYLGIIPFTPSVMINISPDWSGIKRSNTNKVTILKTIFENYMKESWYDSWKYVIENGSKGDHIHLHAVCHMNTERLKSCETHLRKGNHTNQLKKYAKNLKGMGGIIKGNGIQKTFLRTQELVDDKLKYLKEEEKPEGHKNLSVIEDGYVVGCL